MNLTSLAHWLATADLESILGAAIPIVAIIFGCSIPIVAMLLRYQQRRLWHDTARVALEKGQPLPNIPELSGAEFEATASASSRKRQPGDDLRSGLILIAVGAALWFFLPAVAGSRMAYVGLIPGFIGGALLLNALLRKLGGAKDAPPPPQA